MVDHLSEEASTPVSYRDARIPTEVYEDEGDLLQPANVTIPGRVVQPGLEIVIDIDPDATLPGVAHRQRARRSEPSSASIRAANSKTEGEECPITCIP